MTLSFAVGATCGSARTGTVTTARGSFATPCFMPVGTRGAVRTLAADDLEDLGAEIVLGNTYHLMLRPGADVVARLGGLHGFSGWGGHVLTDSGGYQVFSLKPKVDDEGATFTSTYDGSSHHLSPEGAVDVQVALGSDIQMVLDVCPPLPSPDPVIRAAVDRTALWAGRARKAFLAHERPDLSQFGIVQGGADLAMRAESAERTVAVGVRRLRRRRPVGRRGPLGDAAGAGGRRGGAAGRPAPLLHGARRPGRHRRGRGPGRRHVRLRAAHPAGPPRHAPHDRRAGSTSATAGSPTTPTRSTRRAAAACAPAGRGATSATCCRWPSPRRPGC